MKKNHLSFRLSTLLVICFSVISVLSTSAQDVANGEALFGANCASCHKVHEKVVGPALVGITEKRETEWLYKWIKNSITFAKENEDAAALIEEYGGLVMTANEFLSNEEIDDILAYVDQVPVPVEEVVVETAGGGEQSTIPYSLLLGIIIALALLVLALLRFIISNLNSQLALKVEKGEVDLENLQTLRSKKGSRFTLSPMMKLNLTLGVLTVAFLGAYYYGYSEVGIQQGYAPTQPIEYSHKVHAGQYEIECSYCHVGVERGKNATIPAVNICLNCHNEKDGVLKDSPEIKKIHAAVKEDRPIEWIRIHNLPDLAYFNHFQHYKIAGIACQKCHGPIETMDVVQQQEILTMGWCIECHRETEVNLDNEYYQLVHKDKIDELSKMSNAKGITISQLGGMECAKCHY